MKYLGQNATQATGDVGTSAYNGMVLTVSQYAWMLQDS
jgi:hypothetical protein